MSRGRHSTAGLPGPEATAAVVVAHPDDETIWCGGLILANPQWQWTILSLCRAGDPDRGPKFRRVCEHLKARAIQSDVDDSSPLLPIDPVRDIGSRVRRHLGGGSWALCVTHGVEGEYGHPRHRQAHREVLRLVSSGALRCGELWTFAYECDAASGCCRPKADADVRVVLTPAQLDEKRRIVRELYGYGEDSFEVRACISPEAFCRHGPAQGGARP